MKQGISPAVAVVVIIVVLVVAVAIGYFAFLRPKGGKAAATDDMQEKMKQGEQYRKQAEQQGRARGGSGGEGSATY